MPALKITCVSTRTCCWEKRKRQLGSRCLLDWWDLHGNPGSSCCFCLEKDVTNKSVSLFKLRVTKAYLSLAGHHASLVVLHRNLSNDRKATVLIATQQFHGIGVRSSSPDHHKGW